ncbi:hypothetical protein [Candidatus Bealeia paramacronuclearis]|uniref:hypothetical protein n=1 Tax=Candidatus Bealeia paramacronuclearis TaxID=1921001 RepID=UPI002F260422
MHLILESTIWEINLDTPGKQVREGEGYGPFPYYLYTETIFDKAPYFFNIDIFKKSIDILINFDTLTNCPNKNTIERGFSLPLGKSIVLKHSKQRIEEAKLNSKNKASQISSLECEFDASQEQLNFIENNILHLIKSHKNIKFLIFFHLSQLFTIKLMN